MGILIVILSTAAWACFGISFIIWLPAYVMAQYQSFHGKYWWQLQGTDEHYDVLAECKRKALLWTIPACVIIYPVALFITAVIVMPSKVPALLFLVYPFVTMLIFFPLRKIAGAKQEIGSGHTLLKFCGKTAVVGATCMVGCMLLMMAFGRI